MLSLRDEAKPRDRKTIIAKAGWNCDANVYKQWLKLIEAPS